MRIGRFAHAIAITLVLAAGAMTGTARADACLDASDEARALLGRKRLLEARAQLRLCAASTCDDAVRVLCNERLEEVTARLPTVTFDVKDRDGRDLSNAVLTIDGTRDADGAQGAEITLEPGPHVFVFEVPNEERVEHRLVLVEREKGRREHIVIGRAREAATAPQPPDTAATPTVAPDASPWRTAGFVTLGASAVALGIGAAFGISAIVKNDDAGCDASNVCDDPRSRHDARIAANISTVSFVVGGALAAAGVGLLLFGPRRGRPHAGLRVFVTSTATSGEIRATSAW